jgi:hypothetical protein
MLISSVVMIDHEGVQYKIVGIVQPILSRILRAIPPVYQPN